MLARTAHSKTKRVKSAGRKKQPKGFTKVFKVRFTRYILYIVVVSLSLVSLLAYAGYKHLSTELAFAFSPSSYDISDNKILTIMFISINSFDADPITVTKLNYLIVDENTKKILYFTISPDISLDLPGKYGEEPLSKVIALGKLNSNKQFLGGVDLMDTTLSNIFGLKVDRYIIVDNSLSDQFSTIFEDCDFKSLFDLSTLRSIPTSLRTNLKTRDVFRIKSFIEDLPTNRVIRKNINNSITQYDLELIDETIQDLMFDSSLALENKKVAVLNGTDIPGVASFGARVISNMGGRVVSIDNTASYYQESQIIVDTSDSKSLQSILHFFPVKNIIPKESSKYSGTELYSADIIIIFGFDIKDTL